VIILSRNDVEKIIVGLTLATLAVGSVVFFKTTAVICWLGFFKLFALREIRYNVGPKLNPELGGRYYTSMASLMISFSFIASFMISHFLGYQWMIWIGANAYFTDGGGFIGGKIINSKLVKELFPRMKLHIIDKEASKKKSWEASAIGFLFAFLACNLVFYRYLPILPNHQVISRLHLFVVSLLASYIAVRSDLAESRVKRMAKLSDSIIVPKKGERGFWHVVDSALYKVMKTHGGFLDRIDSLVGVIFFYVLWFACLYFTMPK